jgi:hypothetical protein
MFASGVNPKRSVILPWSIPIGVYKNIVTFDVRKLEEN